MMFTGTPVTGAEAVASAWRTYCVPDDELEKITAKSRPPSRQLVAHDAGR
jgi:hypothetical protein